MEICDKCGKAIELNNAFERVEHLFDNEFSLHEVYDYENELSKEHPNNLHIKDKIRQQLQILRDKGFLRFKGSGIYLI